MGKYKGLKICLTNCCKFEMWEKPSKTWWHCLQLQVVEDGTKMKLTQNSNKNKPPNFLEFSPPYLQWDRVLLVVVEMEMVTILSNWAFLRFRTTVANVKAKELAMKDNKGCAI